MSVSAIIVNYGTARLAARAVASLVVDPAVDEVHLVDNASPGDEYAWLSRTHAEAGWGNRVTLWQADGNLGFGRGNNLVLDALAARDVPPDFVLLLNPDAEANPGMVATLEAALCDRPRAGAAGAAIRAPESTPCASAFRFPTLKSELLRTVNFGPADRLFGGARQVLPPDHPGGPVDWVTGAAVLFRMEALTKVGFFDPGFFLYFEEVELMHRLGAAGWEVLHVPDAQAIHAEGAATGGGGRRRDQPGYLYDSWRHFHLLTRGRVGALLIAGLMVPAAVLNVLHTRLRGRTPTIPRRFFRDHWTRVIRPLFSGSTP